ncbi:MAG: DUF1015 domain-containing protein [Clostridia bacterium]|nr:DUF1015 domain-containing protein [Clostridia bacterium]
MERILPFKALRYNKNIVGNLSAVLAPPYDNISGQKQQKLYDSHPFNVVRLEYGVDLENDNDTENRYSRSAETLSEWMRSGVLVPDRQPAIYIYGQDFELPDGRQLSRKGIVCLVRIDDFEEGTVVPHQETVSRAKNDRLNLMTSCGANFNPVCALYEDVENQLASIINSATAQEPETTVKTIDGVVQKLWVITDEEVISQVTTALEEKRLLIADGHHRYETAINYRNLMQDENPDHTGDELYNYTMMFLEDIADPGLVIFPTHRMVKSQVGYNESAVISQLSESFDIVRIDTDDVEASAGIKLSENTDIPCFAMYTGKDYYYLLRLKSFAPADSVNADKSVSFRHLDVTVLHSLVLGKVFGMTEADLKNQEYLSYTRDISEAVNEVKNGVFQCCFMLNPTKIQQIKDVALEGEKLSLKSSYFYPKLISGLLMNKFNQSKE